MKRLHTLLPVLFLTILMTLEASAQRKVLIEMMKKEGMMKDDMKKDGMMNDKMMDKKKN